MISITKPLKQLEKPMVDEAAPVRDVLQQAANYKRCRIETVDLFTTTADQKDTMKKSQTIVEPLRQNKTSINQRRLEL